MQSPKILYIHAGMGKTGSTSIQQLFCNYRSYFRKNGIYYPSTGNTICHHDLTPGFLTFENNFWKQTDNYIELLKKEIEAVSPQRCLISSELYYRILDREDFANVIKSIFDGYQIKVIVHIRRADKFLPSAYKQQILGFRYRTLNKDFEYFNHIEKLAGIESALGIKKEDVIIRPFEKGQFHQNDLLKDFLHALDIDDPDNMAEKVEPANIKSNIHLDIIEYVRQMSLSVNQLQPTELAAWNRIFSEYSSPDQYPDVSLFGSYENLQETMDCYAPMYEHIARHYLSRPDGVMFYEDAPPDKEHFIPYPPLTIEKIASINGYLNYKIRHECISELKSAKKWTLFNMVAVAMKRIKRIVKKSK